MKNIYLIGMPGCGKSTVGRQLSKLMNIRFVDLDEYIVNHTKRAIDDMFAEGERVFRAAETECLKIVAGEERLVVATGGGVVVTHENAEIMKNSGTVIFIDADVEDILKNCSLEGRPLLKDKNKIYDLYNSRIELYRNAADYIVKNNSTLENVLDKIESLNLKNASL